MKKPLIALVAVSLLFCLAGCHKKKPVKYLNYTLTPNVAARTLTVQCDGSSSGKCAFIFIKANPSDVMLDVGGTINVTEVGPGSMYCSGTITPFLDSCKQTPVPDHQDVVKKTQAPKGAAAPAAN